MLHKFKINGIVWPWRYSRLRGGAEGWTYMPPAGSTSGRKIIIDSRLSGRARLDCEIHEFLHAANGPAMSEDHVTQIASDLARILWALGYRLQNPEG